MSRILAIIRKELLELFGRGNPWRETFNIVAIFVLLGVVLPLQWGANWVNSPFVIFSWAGMPIMLVSSAVLDSFAGERERGTLETLLASCLADYEILLGKILAAVIYGWTIAAVIIPISLIAINVAFHQPGTPWLLFPLDRLILILVFSFLSTWLIASVGVLISLRASTVRQAGQNLSLVILSLMAIPALAVFLLPQELLVKIILTVNNSQGGFLLWGSAISGFVCLDLAILALSFLRFQRYQLLLD